MILDKLFKNGPNKFWWNTALKQRKNMVSLNRPYYFNVFKDCLPQNLFVLFLNTLSSMKLDIAKHISNILWKVSQTSMLLLHYSPHTNRSTLLMLMISFTSNQLTLSWRRSLSYRNQPIDFLSKSMDWLLYDRDHRHERVNVTY